MRALLLGLLLTLPGTDLVLASKTESTGQDSMGAALRKVFKAEEQWLLSVLLSDEAQAKAFEEEGRLAAQADEAARKDFELRWRRKTVDFARQYQRHLSATDIVPDAPSIEKMVTDFEFNVMNYWLMHQSPKVQAEVRKDLADGNSVLGFMRGTVESRVRAKRNEAAAEMAKYIASPESQAALAYKGPKPPASETKPDAKPQPKSQPKPESKPQPKPPIPGQTPAEPEKPQASPPQESAREQLERAAGESGTGARAPSPEDAAGGADRQFSGGGDHGLPPAYSSPENTPSLPNAGLVGPQTGGGFQVKPPPAPVLDRESKAKSNPIMAMAKEMMPSIVGGILGGLLSFFIGGPIGLIVGAVLGAGAGYLLKNKF